MKWQLAHTHLASAPDAPHLQCKLIANREEARTNDLTTGELNLQLGHIRLDDQWSDHLTNSEARHSPLGQSKSAQRAQKLVVINAHSQMENES